MTPIEIKRKELELIRVKAALSELEFRIEEYLDNIERVNVHIQVQKDHIIKLELEINTLNNLSLS